MVSGRFSRTFVRSRSGAKPICPEGERYCGIPVWREYAFEELEGRRVM
jgi:hypothetical protein